VYVLCTVTVGSNKYGVVLLSGDLAGAAPGVHVEGHDGKGRKQGEVRSKLCLWRRAGNGGGSIK